MKQKKYVFLILLVGAAACSNDDEAEKICEDVTCLDQVQAFEDVTAFDTCRICHSSSVTDRQGAPGGYNFDSPDGVLNERGEVLEEVSEGHMPPAPYASTFTQDQKDEIISWTCCSAGN